MTASQGDMQNEQEPETGGRGCSLMLDHELLQNEQEPETGGRGCSLMLDHELQDRKARERGRKTGRDIN